MALADELAAEAVFVHTAMPDPRDLPIAQRAALGTGLLVPTNHLIRRGDVEHFRRTCPARFDAMLQWLGGFVQQPPHQLLERTDVQSAFAAARWAQAWHADLVWSIGTGESALQALLTARLLDLPRVAVFSPDPESSLLAALRPLHLDQAATVVATTPAVAAALLAHGGERLRARLLIGDAAATTPALALAVRGAWSRPRAADAPARGPEAGFRTRQETTTSATSPPAAPFVVVGAERTGSNLLVGVLDAQPGITCIDELWNPRFVDAGTLPWLEPPPADREHLLHLRTADPARLHTRLLVDGAARGATAVGFKLLYFHGLAEPRIVDHLAGDRAVRVIHLLRQDRLRRFLSHAISAANDDWYRSATSADTGPPPPQLLDVVAMVEDFAAIELQEQRFRAVFRHHRTIELDYDHFSSDLGGTTRRLGELFGVPLSPPVARTRKTGGQALARAIANLSEVRAALTGTPWSDLVAD